ncbi:hypothetical protein [Paenibacillus shenyangensis]|uniref:hypothetical protein n=1 Tax=Paenibacillus sp. A9 TaxID=1284352 RepID=UPI00037025B6|nr:hypothetical protein [Paenibacillus sp. A9]
MNQQRLVKCLLSLSLIGIAAGCENSDVAISPSTKTEETKAVQQQNKPSESISEKSQSDNVAKSKTEPSQSVPSESTPSKDKVKSNSWVFADTRSHPYEGKLKSYELKDDELISIDFEAITAIITPTNPTDIISIGSQLGQKSNYPVRNDEEQSSKLTQEELKHLKNGEDFLVLIDDWRDGEDNPVKATEVKSIFYKENGKYFSVRDNKLFDTCSYGGANKCKRISN